MLYEFALLTAAVVSTGASDTRDHHADGYAYSFDDDALAGASLDAQGAQIRAIRHAERDVLVRPRLSFVPELLKSVENL